MAKGYYYIKFYHEALDDPKVATLPDRLWRRFFELCLLAGIEGRDGPLPDVHTMAWRLRINLDDLMLDLKQLVLAELIDQTQEGWTVRNFAKRQAAAEPKERMHQSRQRARHQQYAEDNSYETVTSRNTELIKVKLSKEEEGENPPSNTTFITIPAMNKDGNYAIAERIYRGVTSQMTIPSGKRDDAITVLLRYYQKYEREDMASEALMPYYQAWLDRNYRKDNMSWLIDWAAVESIPPKKVEKKELTDEERTRLELSSMKMRNV